MEEGGLGGNLALFLAGMVVGDGGAVGDAAHAADDAAACEHGFAEEGFATGGVADDGDIAQVLC